jgi:hypothetical protein
LDDVAIRVAGGFPLGIADIQHREGGLAAHPSAFPMKNKAERRNGLLRRSAFEIFQPIHRQAGFPWPQTKGCRFDEIPLHPAIF